MEASRSGSYTKEKFLILNSEAVIEMNASTNDNVRKIINEGIIAFKASALLINLNSISVLSEKQYRNIVGESKSKKERGAIDNSVENANGMDVFVRLSAFENDRRVDKVNRCLRSGTFTTTMDDYLKCKATNDEPIERYALPNNDKIQFAFHIQPINSDTLQKGIVQPANGKQGGGKEVYFANGTAVGTFIKQISY